MGRLPCHYCKTEDGVDSLGIGFSGRCGRHYWRPAFPPEAEAPKAEPEARPIDQLPPRDSQSGSHADVASSPVEQAPDEGSAMPVYPLEMFPLGSGPARRLL